jgi:small subunit ribosomal protein S2
MKRKNTHIIDIVKTRISLTFTYDLIKKYTERKATFIFVGTRKVAKDTIKYNAQRTNSFYVSERWLGGTLTNHRTIQKQVNTLIDLEAKQAKNYEGYTKKEGVMFEKRLQKLLHNLSGIRDMKFKPSVMIVADPMHDIIAVKEARQMGIKIIGITDTNTDPSLVDVPIPANDDSIKSVTLIMTILADAIVEAKGGKVEYAFKDDDEIILPSDPEREARILQRKTWLANRDTNRRNSYQSSDQGRPQYSRRNEYTSNSKFVKTNKTESNQEFKSGDAKTNTVKPLESK